MKRYETKRSAIIPCLERVQKENGGWVSRECVEYLSRIMSVPLAWVEEVVSFYTLFNKKPVGNFHIQVCCNVSCHMKGASDVVESLCKSFKVKEGEMSSDGQVTVNRVECLGACDGASMAQINDEYHYNLNPERAVELVREMIEKKNGN